MIIYLLFTQDSNRIEEINSFLKTIGLEIANKGLAIFVHDSIIICITIIVSFILYILTRKIIEKVIYKIIQKTKTNWDDILFNEKFFNKITYIIPPLATQYALMFMNFDRGKLINIGISLWYIIVITLILRSLLNSITKIYESYPVSRNRPISVFIQVTKLFLYSIAIILSFSVITDKDPYNLIIGLGAFAAVLMLIFKDSILGFVAGIQLISNDMVRIGDWIVMEKNSANGTVLEINLYTVKVQNWDMTISTIPTYQLVSESFINWRGMERSNGRRIMRSINIDITSVHFLSNEEIEALRHSKIIGKYIDDSLQQIEQENLNFDNPIDRTSLTNLGVFRHYMVTWIENNPNINTSMTYMVRQLEPTPAGIPIQIYCFSRIQEWVKYEDVQANIFDHIMAVLPQFNLRILQFTLPNK